MQSIHKYFFFQAVYCLFTHGEGLSDCSVLQHIGKTTATHFCHIYKSQLNYTGITVLKSVTAVLWIDNMVCLFISKDDFFPVLPWTAPVWGGHLTSAPVSFTLRVRKDGPAQNSVFIPETITAQKNYVKTLSPCKQSTAIPSNSVAVLTPLCHYTFLWSHPLSLILTLHSHELSETEEKGIPHRGRGSGAVVELFLLLLWKKEGEESTPFSFMYLLCVDVLCRRIAAEFCGSEQNAKCPTLSATTPCGGIFVLKCEKQHSKAAASVYPMSLLFNSP